MRGRLIFPFLVELAQLDTVADAATVTALARPGYDPDFKEPVVIPAAGGGAGAVQRKEKAAIRVPAQIEQGEWLKLQQFFNGDSPDTKIVVVMHFSYLEDNGLVDADGSASIRVGDRMTAIYDRDGNVQATIKDPVFVTQVQPGSFGIGNKRNLLFVYFDCRTAGIQP